MVLYFECNWAVQQKFLFFFFALYLLGVFLTENKINEIKSSILENMENLSRAFGAKEMAQKNDSSQNFEVLATGSSGITHIHHSGVCMSCLIF